MTYTPPGWTEDRLRVATVDDLRQIPEDRLHKIDDEILENVEARKIVCEAQHNEYYRLERERRGLPPAPPKPLFEESVDAVVQVVERAGFDDFGFIVFRADYSDEKYWDKWQELFLKRLDDSLAQASGGRRIEDKLFTPIFDDRDSINASLERIQEAYNSYDENEGVPPGLGTGMCLVVDKNAMESLLNPVAGEDPWVIAMDLSFDHSREVPEGEYPGYFRVAVDSVIPEFYPFVSIMTPPELWASANPIWVSAY
ncbi:hypothetical protein BO94DRAFT_545347 [Aspergillus sclerotioniger CBS 115572]|uniref:Uncharacterized protein n=1 Tax=Aspergillus sclerotioniger CBS 115572 TaxID=1450535 RepID=A0A317WW58_9EURO|nr:hypothetical protein BO94DRAFT_545347 [Aspergillus sclerotioniger CBS 115572]PWY90626.1 hypothetical protein BO94DRAFT_545347 [Aspergillus sclerotioniger CBS 115572]